MEAPCEDEKVTVRYGAILVSIDLDMPYCIKAGERRRSVKYLLGSLPIRLPFQPQGSGLMNFSAISYICHLFLSPCTHYRKNEENAKSQSHVSRYIVPGSLKHPNTVHLTRTDTPFGGLHTSCEVISFLDRLPPSPQR